MRRLHRTHRRRGDALMRRRGRRRGRQEDHHHRGARRERRADQSPEGLGRPRRAAMRLLPERHDHGGLGAVEGNAEADPRRYRQSDHQYLSVRHLPAGARGDPSRCHVPFAPSTSAQGAPEVNAWVVIKPDDTVVIRIARSEMGQGTLTGLAQMVAEELECDWSKVTTEYPTPGQSVARKRAWGDFSTGGSRGIRTSHEYVRKGGATARMMLVQAAANEWKVPASECTAANSVVTHTPSGRTTTFGKVAEAGAFH